MRTLAQLGDVDFDESDFIPQWFQPDHGIATIDLILERAGRRFSAPVRGELVQLRDALAEARSRGCTFYLVEIEPSESLRVDTALRKVASRGREGQRETATKGRLTKRCTRRPPARS